MTRKEHRKYTKKLEKTGKNEKTILNSHRERKKMRNNSRLKTFNMIKAKLTLIETTRTLTTRTTTTTVVYWFVRKDVTSVLVYWKGECLM